MGVSGHAEGREGPGREGTHGQPGVQTTWNSRPEASRLGILENKASKLLRTLSSKLLYIYPHGISLDKESTQIAYCFSEEMSHMSCQLTPQKSLN